MMKLRIIQMRKHPDQNKAKILSVALFMSFKARSKNKELSRMIKFVK
jgi:hypothetical protein